MQARLKVVQDNANLKQVKLLPVTMIGRSADCHLKIASSEVSRNHCRITVTDNEVLIEDLNSSNGTYVNQARIPPAQQIPLPPGAKLHIGPAAFIVDYTPPVTLETMPTTVIKSSELPFLQELASPSAPPAIIVTAPVLDAAPPADSPRVAAATVPVDVAPATVQPASAAPAERLVLAPAHIIVPDQEPAPVIPTALVSAALPSAAIVVPGVPEPVNIGLPIPKPAVALAIPMTAEPKTSPSVAAPAPMVAPVAKAAANPIPVVVPPVVATTAPPDVPPSFAAEQTVTMFDPSQATVIDVSPQSLPPAPNVAAFDFLGASSPSTAMAPVTDTFNFGSAAPPATFDKPSTPPAAKPSAAKKTLFGFFGKKDKPTNSAKTTPSPTFPPSAPPSAAISETASPLPPTPEPLTEPAPPASDDPFAFLKGV